MDAIRKASVLNLVAVSIERFLVIVFPMKARRLCTISKSRKGLLLVWIASLLLASPVLFTKTIYPITYYNNATSLTAYYCWDSDDDSAIYVALYQISVMFAIPAIFMIICYFFVIKELWISTKTIEQLTGNSVPMVGMKKTRALFGRRRDSPRDNNGAPTFITNCEEINANDANIDAKDVLDAKDSFGSKNILDANDHVDTKCADINKIFKGKVKGQKRRSASKDSICSVFTNGRSKKLSVPYQIETTLPTQTTLLETSLTADRRKRLSSGSSIDPRKRSDSPTILDLISLDDANSDANEDAIIEAENILQSSNAPLSMSCPNNIHILVDNRRQLASSSGDAISFHRPSSGMLERQRAPSVPMRKQSHVINSIQYKSGYAQMHQQTTARKQVIKMLLLIVILFLLCWGPRLIMNVLIKLRYLENFSQIMYSARITCYLLSFIHSALNPFVYGLMSSNFRDKLFVTCRRRARENKSKEETCAREEVKNFEKNTKKGTSHHKFNPKDVSIDPLSAHAVLGNVSKLTVIDARGGKRTKNDKRIKRRHSASKKPLLSFLSRSKDDRHANHNNFEIINQPVSIDA